MKTYPKNRIDEIAPQLWEETAGCCLASSR